MTDIKQLILREQQAGFCDFSITDDLLLRVEASALGVFRLRIGSESKLDDSKLNVRALARKSLLLARQEITSEFEVNTENKGWRLSHGSTSLLIKTQPFSLQFYQDDQVVLSTVSPSALLLDDKQWRLNLALTSNETVYGLGRVSDTLNRRGQEIQSDSQDYLPLSWSAKGWGVFVQSLHKVSHSIGLKKHPNQYGITVEDDVLDVFFYIAPPAEILNQFSATIGRPGQPPLRAMGLWLDQQENQTISEFMSTVEQWEKAGLTVDTLNFAAPSMFSFQSDKLVMDWDEGRVGDVRQFIADYAKGKKHVCVPSFPGIPVDTALFQDLEDRAWLLLDDKGKAYQVATPKGKVGVLDLTYKDAYQYWESRHQQLLEGTDIAVSIAQTIHIPDNVSARQGEEKAFLRQLYSAWLEQSLFEGQAFHKTPSEAFVRRQALSLNSVRSTGLYLQDTIESYTDLENLLQRHLSTQMSGVIAQSHVLNLQATEARLYLRALALSIFSAGFSFVADEAYWPTQFDEKTQQTVKILLALRYRLIPYVLGVIEDATRTGLPVQRAMALAYPQDTYAHQYHQQFLFGPALLVAPILDSQDSKCIYLPEGDAWWDLNTGVRYEGGQVLEYHCDTSAIPVFGREGHMLCLGPDLKGLEEFNTARVLDEVWLFGMPIHNPVVMRNKIRVMQMQGSSYIKGFEGLRILPSEGLEVKRRGAEVRISRER